MDGAPHDTQCRCWSRDGPSLSHQPIVPHSELTSPTAIPHPSANPFRFSRNLRWHWAHVFGGTADRVPDAGRAVTSCLQGRLAVPPNCRDLTAEQVGTVTVIVGATAPKPKPKPK
jgi:hypothetical protein